MGIIDKLTGGLHEKKAFYANEARAKALPQEFAAAYKEIQKYIFFNDWYCYHGATQDSC